MLKNTTTFFCKECGYESAKWLGKCPGCNNWNSFVEERISKSTKHTVGFKDSHNFKASAKKLTDITVSDKLRIDTGFEELNRVFGGGMVEGSLTLFGGEPGIGKSTLIMQMCGNLARYGKVLYISGEESESQVKLRCDRLKIKEENILFLSETNISNIEEQVKINEPKFCIVDSIQTMYDEEISSVSGSVSQVKEVTARLMYMAKQNGITVIVIGHVTKDGVIAGPRILEHMVDVVLYIEGERFFSHRIIRGVKNRFGSTNEIGIFDMQDKGMVEIKNISELFLSESNDKLSGNALVATLEGTSTILLEVQALTSHSYYNMPRRVANGIDLNRLNMILAVLEKRCNINLGSQDIYINVIGGIKIDEPAVDLAVAMSIVSSYRNKVVNSKTVFIGEIGLTGEIRSVNSIEKRVKEIEKMGYDTVIGAKKQIDLLKETLKLSNIKTIGVETIDKVIEYVLN
ncbi:MAG: DNA repair protein RadA [Clostridia bacterium]|nr:DNA repair protein RadA [Clostridia bacterium]